MTKNTTKIEANAISQNQDEAEKTSSKKRAATTKPKKTKIRANKTLQFADIDPHDEVECYNMTSGVLVFGNPKTGETTLWHEYGDMNILEVQDLIQMRNAARSFFTEPWIMIYDEDILQYLRVDQYYKNIPRDGNFDDIFDLPLEEILEKVSSFTNSTKKLVAQRAVAKIEDGSLDSMKTVSALEKTLGFQLVERDA